MLSNPTSLMPASNPTPPSKEFAGIASVHSDSLSTDDIKYHGFMATIQEELAEPQDRHKANTDWNSHSQPIDTAAISIQPQKTNAHVSTEISLFLIDSGASFRDHQSFQSQFHQSQALYSPSQRNGDLSLMHQNR